MLNIYAIHNVSKNDTDVAHYNVNPHQPIFFWESTLSNGDLLSHLS